MTRILLVDAWFPTPTRDAGSLRVVNLLRLMAELSCSVTFAADAYSRSRQDLEELSRDGVVRPLPQPEGVEPQVTIERHLAEEGANYDIVWLCRAHVARRYVDMARRLAPRARVVFDTLDLTYLRGFRGAKVKGNVSLLRQTLEAKKDELYATSQSDLTLVVSPVEQEMLARDCPGAAVDILSLIIDMTDVTGRSAPFETRKGLVFVGGFSHHPNEDGLDYFLRHIHPLILADIPGITTTVVGTSPPRWLTERVGQQGLRHFEHVPDLAPLYDSCAVSVAPLRYGAGVKGKVLGSMSHGVPVVATAIAAEGLPVRHGRDILIADDPASFRRCVVELSRDADLWRAISANGLELVKNHFTAATARPKLADILKASEA